MFAPPVFALLFSTTDVFAFLVHCGDSGDIEDSQGVKWGRDPNYDESHWQLVQMLVFSFQASLASVIIVC